MKILFNRPWTGIKLKSIYSSLSCPVPLLLLICSPHGATRRNGQRVKLQKLSRSTTPLSLFFVPLLRLLLQCHPFIILTAHRLIKITKRMFPIPTKFHLSCGVPGNSSPVQQRLAQFTVDATAMADQNRQPPQKHLFGYTIQIVSLLVSIVSGPLPFILVEIVPLPSLGFGCNPKEDNRLTLPTHSLEIKSPAKQQRPIKSVEERRRKCKRW